MIVLRSLKRKVQCQFIASEIVNVQKITAKHGLGSDIKSQLAQNTTTTVSFYTN
jgi:hypothetical protein